MKKKMRVMTEKPLNAETPIEALRTWTTDNDVFFKRNQGQIMQKAIKLSSWKLSIEGLVKHNLTMTFEEIRRMPKVEVANTLECSGNSRSLLEKKASGNPWTIGGVGNAIWGGVWLKDLLAKAELKKNARHVSFEGFEKPLGKAGIKFIRSIPPMRALALGWTGANCVKWLHKITVLDQPHEGFFMDRVYRVFQKGEDPKTGEVVKAINIKSIIVEPANAEALPTGIVPIRGAAYAGEAGIQAVDVSLDDGRTWQPTKLIGPEWEARQTGEFTIMVRATDTMGRQQPETANWNVLGYGNNGIREHAIAVKIV
jgi:DMSO/TMAO reductase YedYZ molybdopterin-dependent catalytic subunit